MHAYVILCELDDAADAGDVDNTGSEGTADVLRALLQKTGKGGGHVVDAEGVDLVKPRPLIEATVVEQPISEGLGVLLFRSIWSVEPPRTRALSSGATTWSASASRRNG